MSHSSDKPLTSKQRNVQNKSLLILLKNKLEVKMSVLSMKYSTIETKEVDRIGYNGFLFPVKAEVRRITSFFFLMSFEMVNCKHRSRIYAQVCVFCRRSNLWEIVTVLFESKFK